MERTLENLYIWKESRMVVNSIYRMLAQSNDWGFKDQIQRAAVSIMNNIAEGFDSGSDAKFINYLNIAKGSCSENAVKRITAGIVNLIGIISHEAQQ